MLSETSIKATGRVLGLGDQRRRSPRSSGERNGPELLDMLTALSVGKPRDEGNPTAISAGRQG